MCQQWVTYADDCTVRSGRVVDGVIVTDAEYLEYSGRIGEEPKREVTVQPLKEAFAELSYDPTGLDGDKPGKRTQPKPQAKPTVRAPTPNSTFAFFTPSTSEALAATSLGNDPATGQNGDVKVIVISTFPFF